MSEPVEFEADGSIDLTKPTILTPQEEKIVAEAKRKLRKRVAQYERDWLLLVPEGWKLKS